MKTVLLSALVGAGTLIIAAYKLPAATVFVWQDSPNPLAPYTNWATAAHVIQDAVDAAQAQETVLVTNGVYATGGRAVYGLMTNRVSVDKPLVVQSVNGPDFTIIQGWQVPAVTNGDGAIRCVYLTNGAVLSGFTLTNGATRSAGDQNKEQCGGGVWCESASAGVSNCVLSSSSAYAYGCGAYSGTLDNCIITGNVGSHGGGTVASTLNNCTVSRNLSYRNGGGAYNGTLNNCVITDNSAQNGGATFAATLNNCVITGNSAYGYGGGAYWGMLNNCTVTANSALQCGGVFECQVNNCVVYYNTANSDPNYRANYYSAMLNYCCTTPLPTKGAGNFILEPQLASASHLSASSPCRAAGSVVYSMGTDIDGEDWRSPPSVGCDEYRDGEVTGPLNVEIVATLTNVAVDSVVNFRALIGGRLSASAWDFGDRTILSNRPYTSHAWSAVGTYGVALRAWNETNPDGLSATVTVQVVAVPVRYVALTSESPVWPYSSWATAATNIQEAVDAAASGDLVLVSNGVYAVGGRAAAGLTTNRVAVHKPVTLCSVNGPEVTVIQGYQVPGTTNGDEAIRCVYLTNGAVLSGFTLTNGATHDPGDTFRDYSGGGVWCESTNALVTNCIFTGNSSYWGGGAFDGSLYNCTIMGNSAADSGGGTFDGRVNNCTFISNSAYFGGGAYGGTLHNCTLTRNSAFGNGGGTYGSSVSNSAIADNSAVLGGGVYFGILSHCRIISNTAVQGGGIFGDSWDNCVLNQCVLAGNSAELGGGNKAGTLYNCMIIGNTAFQNGGGAYQGYLNNCVVYYNTCARGWANHTDDYNNASDLRFCCTTPLSPAGISNITGEPQLASLSHLTADSPCRGAGSTAYASGVDVDGQPWASPPSIGCDEYWPGELTGPLSVGIRSDFTNVSVRFPVTFIAEIEGKVSASRWDFGDGTIVSNHPYATHSWATVRDYSVTLTAYNQSYPEGRSATVVIRVVVPPVHYVAVASPEPVSPYTNWETASRTIQDAVDAVTTPWATVLVSNGVYAVGGRAVYGMMTNRVVVDKPVVVRSVNGPEFTLIQGAWVLGTTNGEGAVRCVYLAGGAVLSGFTLTRGATRIEGDEDKERSGGGVWCKWTSEVVSNCVLSGNSANAYGCGAYSGTLNNCIIAGNMGSHGAGAYNSMLSNCMLTGNLAYGSGGGVYYGSLNNCTISGNSATSGGGADSATLNNCILYYNKAGSGSNYSSCTLNYCCTAPASAIGTGNITNQPCFVDYTGGNLRLQSNSPCINAGANSYVSGSTDLDGLPRIVSGTVDIGAYEYQRAGSVISFAWLQRYGLPIDGSADYTHADNDGLNNWQEWQADTDPTNALSCLRITAISNGPPVTVQFTSSSNRLYTLGICTNLSAPAWLDVPGQTDLPGKGGGDSLSDTNAVAPRFYRLRVRLP